MLGELNVSVIEAIFRNYEDDNEAHLKRASELIDEATKIIDTYGDLAKVQRLHAEARKEQTIVNEKLNFYRFLRSIHQYLLNSKSCISLDIASLNALATNQTMKENIRRLHAIRQVIIGLNKIITKHMSSFLEEFTYFDEEFQITCLKDYGSVVLESFFSDDTEDLSLFNSLQSKGCILKEGPNIFEPFSSKRTLYCINYQEMYRLGILKSNSRK